MEVDHFAKKISVPSRNSLYNKKLINFLGFLAVKFDKDDLLVEMYKRALMWRCTRGCDCGDVQDVVIVEMYRRVFLNL